MKFAEKHQIIVFLILVFLIAAIFALSGVYLLAAASSSIAAIITMGMIKGKHGIKELLGTFKNWRSHPILYLISLVLPIAIILAATAISSLFGNPFPFPELNKWLYFPLMFAFLTIQAGLGEEIGWRGYLTPKLSEKYNILVSSLIVGCIWALWHLPMYFIPGVIQYEISQKIGFFPIFIMYSLFIIASSVVLSWIFFISNKNLWLPVLLHGSVNAFAWLFAYDDLELYGGPLMLTFFVIIWVIIAILISLPFIEKIKKKET
jgi:membrane protease YdiL (CAAX protease family)